MVAGRADSGETMVRRAMASMKRAVQQLTRAMPAALATLIIAGLGGALIQRYLSRAKPQVFLTAIIFRGHGDEMLPVSAEIVREVRNISWLKPLNRYEPFSGLDSEEQMAGSGADRLERFTTLLKEWYEDVAREGAKRLTKAVLLDHPCLGSAAALCSDIAGPLVLEDVLAPPESIAALKASAPIILIPMVKTDLQTVALPDEGLPVPGTRAPQAFVISEGRPRIFLGVWPFYSDRQKAAVELMAESFSRGHTANILYYSQQLLDSGLADLKALNGIRAHLQAALLPNARVGLDVQVYNAGDSPMCFRPYFGLRLADIDHKEKTILMVTESDAAKAREAMSDFSGVMPGALGSLWRQPGSESTVESYLPRSSETPYLTVGPKSNLQISLISAAALGDSASVLRDYYKVGSLSCRLIGITTDGSAIWSQEAYFAQQMSDRDKGRLGAPAN
jgi:hypothetical protein